MATSREGLRRTGPSSCGRSRRSTFADGADSAAVELFVERAPAVNAGFALDDASRGRGGGRDLPAAGRDRVGDRVGGGTDGVDEPAGRAATVSATGSGCCRAPGAGWNATRRCASRWSGPTTCSTTTNGRCWAAVRSSPTASTSPPPRTSAATRAGRVRGVGPVGLAGAQVAGHRRAGRRLTPVTGCWRRSASSPRNSSPPPAPSTRSGTVTPATSPNKLTRSWSCGRARSSGWPTDGSTSSSPTFEPGSAGQSAAMTCTVRRASPSAPASPAYGSSGTSSSHGRRCSSRAPLSMGFVGCRPCTRPQPTAS